MNLLDKIKSGQFQKYEKPDTWNRMSSYLMKGATVYEFDNGIELSTYTGKSWFLRIDGEIFRKYTDDQINKAFQTYRKKVLDKI